MYWIGLIVGAAIVAGIFLLVGNKVKVAWWQWLLAAIAIILLFMAVQHFTGSLAEREIKAAWIGLAIFGVPAIILGVLTWQLVLRGQKEA